MSLWGMPIEYLFLTSRHRAGSGRFRGLRLLHTHLRGEGLTQDDLTDLSLLRLDMVLAFKVTSMAGLAVWNMPC